MRLLVREQSDYLLEKRSLDDNGFEGREKAGLGKEAIRDRRRWGVGGLQTSDSAIKSLELDGGIP